ncbi:hypothetical protein [Streptomyces sp. AC495_CC817]|uniref:hypothetical protein n=1 Tax=Streptomyces sp. AC495_CC817 TaxID=2823900 RepID=UPI001C263CD2|nr:hypothetical protein [Streptomyces sp. AC495_CC817]
MSMREFKVSYSMHVEAETAQEAAEHLADFLTNTDAPQRGVYEIEDEDGKPTHVDLGMQRREW